MYRIKMEEPFPYFAFPPLIAIALKKARQKKKEKVSPGDNLCTQNTEPVVIRNTKTTI